MNVRLLSKVNKKKIKVGLVGRLPTHISRFLILSDTHVNTSRISFENLNKVLLKDDRAAYFFKVFLINGN